MRATDKTLGACAVALLLVSQMAIAADPAFRLARGERQLFLDDVGVARIQDLKRTMHQPHKKGAVIRPDREIGEEAKQTRTVPTWNADRKVFQFWDLYGGEPPISSTAGYYESNDGLNWSKPIVGQVEFRGSKENNYISIPLGGGRRTRPGCVVYDLSDRDASRRYKGAGSVSGGLALGASHDGIHWKAIDAPIIECGDDYNLSFDEKGHLFIAAVKRGGLQLRGQVSRWQVGSAAGHRPRQDRNLSGRPATRRLCVA